jgi:AraC family transcriptional regulator, L-rhamnose operon regulatory protein RhaS
MAMQSPHPKDSRLTWLGDDCVLEELEMLGWDAPRQAGDLGLGAHKHRGAFEICLIVGGSVEWWVRERGQMRIHVVEPGQVYLTRPGEVHGGVDAVLHACELYWLQLRAKGDELPGLARKQSMAILRRLRRLPRVIDAAEGVQSAFARLVGEHVQRDGLSEVRARAALHELLVELLRTPPKCATRDLSSAIGRAVRWMEAHLVEDFSIADAAAIAGLSPTQFHDRFHREMGYSPGDWRTRQRIMHAKRLLRRQEAGILDIALSSGFTTSQYFATAFRRITGLTPRQYRRRVSGGSVVARGGGAVRTG